MSKQLSLYVRQGCHLCEAFIEELQAKQDKWQFTVKLIDVDLEPLLIDRYGADVPVLMAGEHEICRHFFDPGKLNIYIEQS